MGRRLLAATFALPLLLGVGAAADETPAQPHVRSWHEAAPPEQAVDVVFLGDGYQRKHLTPTGKYWTDVKRYAKRFMEEPPISWYRDHVNVWAVFLESKDAGVGGDTALGCQYIDDRRVVFGNTAAVRAALSLVPSADIALVMVNVEKAGGAGGSLPPAKRGGAWVPAPTFSAQDTASFDIALHELGHSFAGLGDEYVDASVTREFKLPPKGKDLAYPNLTLAAFVDTTSRDSVRRTAKWGHFLDQKGADHWTWAYEGGYYRKSGVYRPFPDCKMRHNDKPFCPVCCEAFARAICRTAGLPWDPDEYARKHPLRLWR